MSCTSYCYVINFGQQDFAVDTIESLLHGNENAAAMYFIVNSLCALLSNMKNWLGRVEIWSESKLLRG